MSEATPKPEINDEAYNTYVADELGLEEITDLGHLEKDDRLKLELMVENAKMGIDQLPDDPTVRAAVNALILEKLGYSTADNSDEEYLDNETQNLDLQDENTSKLLEVVCEEKFELAMKAARELDPNLVIPDDARNQILTQLRQLSPERVAEIYSEMQKPTLIIVPSNPFYQKITQMNRNQHYRGQNDIRYDIPYRNVTTPQKVRVYIVDGEPNPKQIKKAPISLDARREFEAKRTREKNMDYVGPHRHVVLLQQSLIETKQIRDKSEIVVKTITVIEAKQIGDKSKIVDFETITVLNPKNLADSRDVACASFGSYDRQAYFISGYPNNDDEFVCGRASVQVLEF